MNDKITGAAWVSSLSTFLFSLSLQDWTCIVGLISTCILTVMKIYVDCKHLQYEKQALAKGSFSDKEE